MLPWLALLLVFQLAGEAARHALALPVPGPVLGMLALLLTLGVRGWLKRDGDAVPESLERAVGVLLGHLSLLFVPAGVGVMTHIALLATEAVPLAVALIGSTLAAIATAGPLMVLMERRP
ncbi:CidA/LrgA family protein [Rhodospira trueperi]|uniref:Putative effector of murein hydrolase LrgA, UPF0299 family n=1 Tax=Rhodospira trueperi TaxID=69960 RepID=A0A1G7FZD3_9PROT|nr:CidA/LrgA family protein [Rhodospira trueperi]SDE81190.1 Putative effector of murein hydrolase LrgA, UPF0299 family [Rhodospira trueperi]